MLRLIIVTLTGLHVLLTFECTMECDHCFVWGSPRARGTMSMEDIRSILRQARDVRDIEWIYFEGGEPFLHYNLLAAAIAEASESGFKVGVVTNAYWAPSVPDALSWLEPLTGMIDDFSVSSDLFHSDGAGSQNPENAIAAARQLGIPAAVISIDSASLMHRGRAAEKLLTGRTHYPCERFSFCPHENLAEPGRVHVDPFGNIHICQGIVAGNLFETSLSRICREYEPESHPIAGPLIAGGPAELLRHYEIEHNEEYVDACHLCYSARVTLRGRFPDVLAPDQMHGKLF